MRSGASTAEAPLCRLWKLSHRAAVVPGHKVLRARPDHKVPPVLLAQRVPLAQQDHKATRGRLEQPARLVLKGREVILVLLVQQDHKDRKVLLGLKV